MLSPLPPRYAEWLSYLFDHEIIPGLPEWYWRDDPPVFKAAPEEIAELWIAMMRRSETDLQSYSDEQLGQGLWYLFSNGCSDHSLEICGGGLPGEKITEVYEAVNWLYSGLFSNRCTQTLGHLSEAGSELNLICYMLWDVSPLGWPPEDDPKGVIEKALLNLLERVMHLPHRACIESALHGLGELQRRYPEKVQAIIQPRLASLDQDKELLQYALNAQEGNIL